MFGSSTLVVIHSNSVGGLNGVVSLLIKEDVMRLFHDFHARSKFEKKP